MATGAAAAANRSAWRPICGPADQATDLCGDPSVWRAICAATDLLPTNLCDYRCARRPICVLGDMVSRCPMLLFLQCLSKRRPAEPRTTASTRKRSLSKTRTQILQPIASHNKQHIESPSVMLAKLDRTDNFGAPKESPRKKHTGRGMLLIVLKGRQPVCGESRNIGTNAPW